MTSERGVNLPIGYKLSGVGVIPEDWATKTCAEQFNISAGGDVDLARFSEFADARHSYPIYSNSLDQKGLYGYSSYSAHPSESLTVTARGTLGVATYRDHPYTAIGRVLVLQPRQESAGVFFENFINSRVKFAIESTGVPQLTAPQIGTYTVAVPELAEQRAIAEALSDVDALLAGLDRLIAKKRDLKQAAMQQLLTGQTRLPGFRDKWKSARAREVGAFRGGNGFPLSAQGERAGDYPFFKVSDMNNVENKTFMTTSNNWISEATRKALGAITFPAGAIVFAKVGAAVFLERKTILNVSSCIDNNMAAFVLDRSAANVRFVHFLLLHRRLSDLVSTTALPALSGRQLGEMEFSLPPLVEQRAIADALCEMENELAALEARHAKTLHLKQAMMQALLTGRIRLV